MQTPGSSADGSFEPAQRIVKIRREYNTWVASETIEDFALRYTPSAFRKWTILRVSNTALSAISFLVLEAIGGTITLNYGFINAFWAILAASSIIFLTGMPIGYYAARYGVDMDLLTRGAGFGYIGSTISSFVYASFTFILFALEAAIMAYALELYFHLPLYLGYLICALVVIPLVTHGVTLISRIQMFTQPIWLILMLLPFIAILEKRPETFTELVHFSGRSPALGEFNVLLFGAATAVIVSLISQIGEQVDFLRFMPKQTEKNRLPWYLGVMIGGPGWVLPGMLKLFAGSLLAYLAIKSGLSYEAAMNPTQMYFVGYKQVFSSTEWALAFTTLFVVISQIKINMTNAYAGSLAWSNFFSRLTHSHPGRLVWAAFNALIAVLLMELDIFQALDQVLGLYANIAISWITAVVADLVINKPLGLSPKGIEFRRAYLYDINPVGLGAMLLASILSITAFLGGLGPEAKGLSTFIALVTAFVTSPLIAWATQGKYYIARQPFPFGPHQHKVRCSICEQTYEVEDVAHCPAYQGYICSLCCCLDARCNDYCKPHARLSTQWANLVKAVLPKSLWDYLDSGLGHYLLLMTLTISLLGALLGLIYFHESLTLIAGSYQLKQLQLVFSKIFGALLFASAVIAWWLVLAAKSRRVAQEESNRQYSLLKREIELHRKTDSELQRAKEAADQANQAKSRYITGISHELRTPLNSILGYAQLLDNDPTIPTERKQAIRVIRRSGEHLLSLIEGTLDIARIESGKLALNNKTINFPEFVSQIVSMFELQARNKGLEFRYQLTGELPSMVRADQKRLGQILINILGNAVKFTEQGFVALHIQYAREIATFDVQDSGPGILKEEIERIFDHFARGSAAARSSVGGTGLGLTISRMLTRLMGGELDVTSKMGEGSTFHIRLFLPQVRELSEKPIVAQESRLGYVGNRRKVLVVDNEPVDRQLMRSVLEPLGFEVSEAASGNECLDIYPVFKPDLILMDLAMPGMDGWEACYVIRKHHHSEVIIGIVSANAFDKGLENAAEIPETDFIVKPLNIDELLDWIGRRLDLTWKLGSDVPLPVSNLPHAEGMQVPPVEILKELEDLVHMGYVRGILKKLDDIVLTYPEYTPFCQKMRELAESFQLDVLTRQLKGVGHDAIEQT